MSGVCVILRLSKLETIKHSLFEKENANKTFIVDKRRRTLPGRLPDRRYFFLFFADAKCKVTHRSRSPPTSVVTRNRPSCKSPPRLCLCTAWPRPPTVSDIFLLKNPGPVECADCQAFWSHSHIATPSELPSPTLPRAPYSYYLDALVSKVTHKDTDVSRLAKAICEDRRSAEDKYRPSTWERSDETFWTENTVIKTWHEPCTEPLHEDICIMIHIWKYLGASLCFFR